MPTRRAFITGNTGPLRRPIDKLHSVLKWVFTDARDEQIAELNRLVRTHEQNATTLFRQFEQLSVQFKQAGIESTERHELIVTLTGLVEVLQQDVKAGYAQVDQLTAQLKQSEAQATARAAELGSLLQEREADLVLLEGEVRTLKQVIRSGDLTAPLHAALQRAHR